MSSHFFEDFKGNDYGNGSYVPLAVPRVTLGVLTTGSHTHIVI